MVHLLKGADGVPPFLRSLISRTIPIVLVFVAGLTFAVWLLGSHNPYTPAGYVGYLTKGAVFGKSRFVGVQRGPTSPGRSWLLDVTNVQRDAVHVHRRIRR